jgi:hypothetical protein
MCWCVVGSVDGGVGGVWGCGGGGGGVGGGRCAVLYCKETGKQKINYFEN